MEDYIKKKLKKMEDELKKIKMEDNFKTKFKTTSTKIEDDLQKKWKTTSKKNQNF